MNKTEILRASQFIDTVRRDLGLNIGLQDVRLGRLKFKSEEKQKFNGFVCFLRFFPIIQREKAVRTKSVI